MTHHKVTLNGEQIVTAGDSDQYRVITIVKSIDHLDGEGKPASESSLTVESFEVGGEVKHYIEPHTLKPGDVIQIEIIDD